MALGAADAVPSTVRAILLPDGAALISCGLPLSSVVDEKAVSCLPRQVSVSAWS